MSELRIVCFDAGITHVGMVEARVRGDGWEDVTVVAARCVDLTAIAGRAPRGAPAAGCELRHGRTLAGRFAHFVREYEPTLAAADCLLVEQQPPGSAGQCFEQLLLYALPGKTSTVHPRSVHKFFGHGELDYDGRKRAAEKVAAPLLAGVQVGGADRMHDIADAVCILLFEAERRRREAACRAAAPAVAHLQQFAFTGPLPRRAGQ